MLGLNERLSILLAKAIPAISPAHTKLEVWVYGPNFHNLIRKVFT